MRPSTVLPAAGLLVFCAAAACGDDGDARSGSADPCNSIVGPALGCPARAEKPQPVAMTIGAACDKLVQCGVLAGEFFGRGSSTDCSGDDDCGTGVCLANSEGVRTCRYHHLDHFWCVSNFDDRRTDPCNDRHVYSAEELAATLRCIERTSCGALGLPFSEKRVSQSRRAEFDKYTCKDGDSVFTATICDHGLLAY
jgi:hypothetical protein